MSLKRRHQSWCVNATGQLLAIGNYNGLEVDDAGTLFIASTTLRRLYSFDVRGNWRCIAGQYPIAGDEDEVLATQADLSNQWDIALSPGGGIFLGLGRRNVYNEPYGLIRKISYASLLKDGFPLEGEIIRTAGVVSGDLPFGMTADRAGNAYVALFTRPRPGKTSSSVASPRKDSALPPPRPPRPPPPSPWSSSSARSSSWPSLSSHRRRPSTFRPSRERPSPSSMEEAKPFFRFGTAGCPKTPSAGSKSPSLPSGPAMSARACPPCRPWS